MPLGEELEKLWNYPFGRSVFIIYNWARDGHRRQALLFGIRDYCAVDRAYLNHMCV